MVPSFRAPAADRGVGSILQSRLSHCTEQVSIAAMPQANVPGRAGKRRAALQCLNPHGGDATMGKLEAGGAPVGAQDPSSARRGGWMFAFSATTRKQCVAGVLIAWQLVAGTGISLPLPALPKNSSQRFPCEKCGCGCQTAEQCWRDCCCFSHREKVAWARENGVPVPAFVLAAAEKEAQDEQPRCPHCVARAAASKTSRSSCCSASDEHRHAEKTPSDDRRLSVLAAVRCQGLHEYWHLFATAWPGLTRQVPHVVPGPTSWFASRRALWLERLSPAPPTPPPRVS